MTHRGSQYCDCNVGLYARELSHRTANALQPAIAAIHLGRRRRVDLDEVMSRLNAVASLNRVLAQRPQGLVDAAEQVRGVCATSIAAAGAGDGISAVVEVDPFLMDTATIRPVLMIVAELVSNSVRHAFPEGAGTVAVRIRHMGMETLLVVEDDGVCGGWHRPGGQGCCIVDLLADSIDGRVERGVTVGGSSRIEITFPNLAAAARSPAGHA